MPEIKDIEVEEEIKDVDLLDPEFVKHIMEERKAGRIQAAEARKVLEEAVKTRKEILKEQEMAEMEAFGASVKAMINYATSDTNVTSCSGPWLLPHEAAQMLGVTRKTIRDWYNKKIIKGIVTGGGQHLRVPTSEVYRLKGLRYTAPTEIPAESYYGFEN